MKLFKICVLLSICIVPYECQSLIFDDVLKDFRFSCEFRLFDCGNGSCIADERQCDGVQDCQNGLDESDCITIKPTRRTITVSSTHYDTVHQDTETNGAIGTSGISVVLVVSAILIIVVALTVTKLYYQKCNYKDSVKAKFLNEEVYTV